MANLMRLGGRQFLNQILRNEKSGMLALVRPVTLKPQPPPSPDSLGHDERNMKLGRPQSPHLSIYTPQLTSILSITHRGTGMVLTGYTILFGYAAVALPDTIPHYLDALEQAQVGSTLIFMGKFSLAFPLCYHFWNGIRHLLWDLGRFLTIKEVYLTGYIMLGLTTVSSLMLSFM